MSASIFELLLTFVHFADNKMTSPDNRLYQIRLPIKKFSMMFEPGEQVTLDKLMVPLRGQIKFCQYIMV